MRKLTQINNLLTIAHVNIMHGEVKKSGPALQLHTPGVFTSLPMPSGGMGFPEGRHAEERTPTLFIENIPIGSMYGIYANISGILMVNVTIYSIHGSYGDWKHTNTLFFYVEFKHVHWESRRAAALVVSCEIKGPQNDGTRLPPSVAL